MLTELQKGVKITKEVPWRYNKLSIDETLDTAKQRLTGPATRHKRYSREAETWRIYRLFSNNPAKVYSQWQGSKNTQIDPPKADSELYWKSIWEKEASRNTNAQ